MEEHRLRGNAWTEGHGAAGLSGFGLAHDLFEDEHHRRRRHVAEPGEDAA
jgi:hypothetical protein